jgi:phage host-nuclease inhibitor protein Gam
MANVLEMITAGEVPDAFAGYEDEADPSVGGGWLIRDLGSADWAISRVAECQAEAAEIDRQADAAIERINRRREALKEKAARGEAFFRARLLMFAETHRDEILTGKKRSREFVHGRIQFRKKAERLVVKDREALLAWLATQPVEAGLYRVRLEPELRAIQDRFKTAGEIPPGCEVEPESETVEIKTEAPETALVKGV